MKLKLVIGSLLLVISYLFFVAPANAQFSSADSRTNYLNTNPDVPKNLHSYTQTVFIEIFSTLTCAVAGYDLVNPNTQCLGVDPQSGKIGYTKSGGGLIGIASSMIGMTFEIPISSTHYGKYLVDNFGATKKAQAAATTGGGGGGENQDFARDSGSGFDSLNKLLPLWKVFRNTVYIFFVLVFVIIGLGIMFRIKIDPRTVMTIQNQIPKIIIALVLVTFSYAIAGFLIDLMYVFLYLFYNLIASSGLISQGDLSGFNPSVIQGSNPLQAVGFLGGFGLVSDAAWGLGGIIASLFSGMIGKIIGGIITMMLTSLIVGGVGHFLPFAVPLQAIVGIGIGGGIVGGAFAGNAILGIIGGMIAFIIIAIAVLSALFRLWFQLIKAYVMILISIVLAPFWIAGGLIPGSTISFGSWIRDLGANLAVFPTVLVMFLFGKIFIDAFGKGAGQGAFSPPFVGNPGNSDNFGALIGIGIVLLTPEVVNIVRDTLKSPKFKYTPAIGRSLGVGAGVVGAPVAIPGRAAGQGLSYIIAQKLGASHIPFLGGRGERT